MNRSAAILLAIATALPIVYMFYFFAAFDSMNGQMTQEEMQAKFDLLFRLHLGTMALIGGLLIVYIVYLFRTEHVPKDKKACIFWPNWTAILAETGHGFWLKLDSFFNRPRGCSH